ncbi:hypothetical protein ACOME3_005760 [Neoechinorhynchus agilis]
MTVVVKNNQCQQRQLTEPVRDDSLLVSKEKMRQRRRNRSDCTPINGTAINGQRYPRVRFPWLLPLLPISTHQQQRLTQVLNLPNSRLERTRQRPRPRTASIRTSERGIPPWLVPTTSTPQLQVSLNFKALNDKRLNEIEERSRHLPPLKFIVPVIKQLLRGKNLNTPYTGGLGSYAMVLMVIHFLLNEGDLRLFNLGQLLYKFLRFYSTFDHRKYEIHVTITGTRLEERKISEDGANGELNDQNNPSIINIRDPLDHTNNVGSSSFRYGLVRECFLQAYSQLHNALIFTGRDSILSSIIQLSPEFLRKRQGMNRLIQYSTLRGLLQNHPVQRQTTTSTEQSQ